MKMTQKEANNYLENAEGFNFTIGEPAYNRATGESVSYEIIDGLVFFTL